MFFSLLGKVMQKIDFLFNFKMNTINLILEGDGRELTQLTIEGLWRHVNSQRIFFWQLRLSIWRFRIYIYT